MFECTLMTLSLVGLLTSSLFCGLVIGQQQIELHYVIQEELAVGFQIADVINDAALRSRYPPDAQPTLRFKFLSRPPSGIVIDDVTGVIRTTGRVDREALCGTEELCRERLDVAVRPIAHFMIIKVTVDILDVNDNSPEFEPGGAAHELGEGSPVGAAFVVPAARDRDGREFGVAGYELRPGLEAEYFRLNTTRRLDGSIDLKVVLARLLDRETTPIHRLVVVAYDGGSPRRTGTLSVEVTVTDANDNAPVFEYESYELTIVENLPPGTTIVRVKATDRDLGVNAEVIYYFSESTQQLHGDVFSLNASSGEVSVSGRVDYESAPVYTLMLSARDRGPDPVSADALLTIRVQDANDNAPEIRVNTLEEAEARVALVPEGVKVGTFVAYVLVRDPDSGFNGRFNCTLQDETTFKLKVVYDGEFQLVTVRALDREARAHYTLQLACSDGGLPALYSYRQLDVDVTDENDHTPRFERDLYGVELEENNPRGVIVVQVSATDLDEGENARLTYFLLPTDSGDQSAFEIDRRTGIIKVKDALDREKTSLYRLSVGARDHGTPPLTGRTELRVRVLDLNDEPPRFAVGAYSMGLEENLPPGAEVGYVSARDLDAPPFNAFHFRLEREGGGATEAFQIDPESGRILTTRSLDRETQDTFHLTVEARDLHTLSLLSTAPIVIYVLDRNDNPPRWTHPPPIDLDPLLTFPSRLPVGRAVARLIAFDPDLGENGDIVYSIQQEGGVQHGVFSIDAISGEVMLGRDMSQHPENVTLRVRVTATDRGSPKALSVSRSIRFAVNRTAGAFGHHALGRYDEVVGVDNLVVVVALSSATGLVFVIVLTAMVCVVRRRKAHGGGTMGSNGSAKYNCRVEALKALTAKESTLLATVRSKSMTSEASSCVLPNGCCDVTDDVIRPDIVNCAHKNGGCVSRGASGAYQTTVAKGKVSNVGGDVGINAAGGGQKSSHHWLEKLAEYEV